MDDADPHPHAAARAAAMAATAKNRSQGIRCWQETRGGDVKTLIIADARADGLGPLFTSAMYTVSRGLAITIG